MLFLTANTQAKIICGNLGKRFVCYNADRKRIELLIKGMAKRLGIDPNLALALAKKESGLNPLAYSPKGAIGIMQLMPQTARELGVNPWDLVENIEGGLRYFKMLLEKYKDVRLALAAYNAGPGNVDRHKGIPPIPETVNFVKKVTKAHKKRIRIVRLKDGTLLITNQP